MNFQNHIYELFEEYLKNKILDDESVKKILSKGKEVVEELEQLPNDERKGLLVGHVQSGKTLNFMSVVANAILKGYKTIIILSSCETELHNQTVERVEESFQYKNCMNFMEILECRDGSYNKRIKSDEFISNLISNYDKKVTFFVVLKNKQNIDKLTNIFNQVDGKLKKVLIIDDEGDLASMSSKEKKEENQLKLKESSTLISIKQLFNSLNEKIYLSVTATPQIHLMLPDINDMMPKRVFVTDPGKGYVGISELYDRQNFYKIIPDDEYEIMKNNLEDSNLLLTIIYYYLISWSLLMMEENLNEAKAHSNFLIHTDVKQEKHESCKQAIRNKLNHINDSIQKSENSLEYKRLIKDIKKVISEFKLTNHFDTNLEKDFIEKLKASIKYCETKIINQKNDNTVNTSLTSVVIGSKKLERGITLENLLTTLFINRSRSITAIDTLLQRARWFGYRNKTLDYMKLFTTQQIIDDFREIKIINEDIIKLLKNAEENKIDFELLDKSIFVSENSKLIPTNKVPLNISNKPDLRGHIFLDILKNEFKYYNNLANDLEKSNNILKISSNYGFKTIEFSNFKDFQNQYPDLVESVFKDKIDTENFNRILDSNCKLNVSLVLTQEGKSRERTFIELNNGWAIDNALQGPQQGREKGDFNKYPGDMYWRENNQSLENKIILQIHRITPKLGNKNREQDIYYWYMNIPKEIVFTKWFRGRKYKEN